MGPEKVNMANLLNMAALPPPLLLRHDFSVIWYNELEMLKDLENIEKFKCSNLTGGISEWEIREMRQKQILRFHSSGCCTKIDLASRIFKKMLQKALSVLSNVVNNLSNKRLCHTCVIPCYFSVFFVASHSISAPRHSRSAGWLTWVA